MELTQEQLAQLLKDAEKAHGEFEKTLGHRYEAWPAWYADYIINKLKE